MIPGRRWPDAGAPPPSRVALLGPRGQELGIVTLEAARAMAVALALDLVAIGPRADPPVLRIMDYAAFKRDLAAWQAAAPAATGRSGLKEVRFRFHTAARDPEV